MDGGVKKVHLKTKLFRKHVMWRSWFRNGKQSKEIKKKTQLQAANLLFYAPSISCCLCCCILTKTNCRFVFKV